LGNKRLSPGNLTAPTCSPCQKHSSPAELEQQLAVFLWLPRATVTTILVVLLRKGCKQHECKKKKKKKRREKKEHPRYCRVPVHLRKAPSARANRQESTTDKKERTAGEKRVQRGFLVPSTFSIFPLSPYGVEGVQADLR
jgi:hypothetical protein